MEMNRRDVLRALAATAGSGGIAHGRARPEGRASTTGITSPSTTEFKGLERVMALFKQKYPDIAVTQENIPNPEYMSKMTAAVVANAQARHLHGRCRARRRPCGDGCAGRPDRQDQGVATLRGVSGAGLAGRHGRRKDLRDSGLHLRRLDVLPEGLVRREGHRAADDLSGVPGRCDQGHRPLARTATGSACAAAPAASSS